MSATLSIRFNPETFYPEAVDPAERPDYLTIDQYFAQKPRQITNNLTRAGILVETAAKIEEFLKEQFEPCAEIVLSQNRPYTLRKNRTLLPFSLLLTPEGDVYVKSKYHEELGGLLKIKKLAISIFSGKRFVRLIVHVENPTVDQSRVKEKILHEHKVLSRLKGIPQFVQIKHLFYGVTQRGKPRYTLIEEECERGELISNILSLPEYQLYLVGTDILEGVQKLHSLRIAHRDIKSDNIFLTGYGSDLRAVIGDFDAALLDPIDQKGIPVGTLDYLAPEKTQRRKEITIEAECACDIWSLGIVFSQLFGYREKFQEIEPVNSHFNELKDQFKLRALTALGYPKNYEVNQKRFFPKPKEENFIAKFIYSMLQLDPKKRAKIDELVELWHRFPEVQKNLQYRTMNQSAPTR